MPSFEFDIGERERAGSRFITDVKEQLQHALAKEKAERKLTFQSIGETLGVNRSVVNRMFMGLENMTIKSIAELLWAIGWEPHFEARKVSTHESENEFLVASEVKTSTSTSTTAAPKQVEMAA